MAVCTLTCRRSASVPMARSARRRNVIYAAPNGRRSGVRTAGSPTKNDAICTVIWIAPIAKFTRAGKRDATTRSLLMNHATRRKESTMKRTLLITLLSLALSMVCADRVMAQGGPGTGMRADTPGAGMDREAMKARRQEQCKANPQQCEEMKAKMKAHREQCKAEPQKCRDEMKARREARCKADPQRCEAAKAKMKERHEQCKAEPQKCHDEMKSSFEERCKQNPAHCEDMKARMKERQEQCKANPDKCGPGKGPHHPEGK